MIKLCILLILATLALADDIREAEMKLDTLFSEENLNSNANCGRIEGALGDACYECYMCEDNKVKKFKSVAKELRLKSSDCKTVTTVCCIPQENLVVRSGESCGNKATDHVTMVNGKVQTKSTVRSVLIGEYPWRAWVYTKSGKLICAATVVDDNTEVVMTSASCVQGYQAGDLGVAFTRNSYDAISLRSIIVHPSYTPSKKHVNDIALLVLSKEQRAPGWVLPVCISRSSPLHATTCISISDDDNFLSTVVPLPKKCEEYNIKKSSGQTCAVAPLDDYIPERGAALLCQDELRTASELYFAAGVALTTTDSVTTYTDVHQYYDWIIDNIGQNSSK